MRAPFRKHYKSRFPACNVSRLDDDVATDFIFSKVPAVDSGVTMAALFVGKLTKLTAVYPLMREKQFAGALQDFI